MARQRAISPTIDPSSNGRDDAPHNDTEPEVVSAADTNFDTEKLEAASTTPPATPDPFDLASLRLDSNRLDQQLGVRRVLMSIPVRKPDKSWFFRAHSEYSI